MSATQLATFTTSATSAQSIKDQRVLQNAKTTELDEGNAATPTVRLTKRFIGYNKKLTEVHLTGTGQQPVNTKVALPFPTSQLLGSESAGSFPEVIVAVGAASAGEHHNQLALVRPSIALDEKSLTADVQGPLDAKISKSSTVLMATLTPDGDVLVVVSDGAVKLITDGFKKVVDLREGGAAAAAAVVSRFAFVDAHRRAFVPAAVGGGVDVISLDTHKSILKAPWTAHDTPILLAQPLMRSGVGTTTTSSAAAAAAAADESGLQVVTATANEVRVWQVPLTTDPLLRGQLQLPGLKASSAVLIDDDVILGATEPTPSVVVVVLSGDRLWRATQWDLSPPSSAFGSTSGSGSGISSEKVRAFSVVKLKKPSSPTVEFRLRVAVRTDTRISLAELPDDVHGAANLEGAHGGDTFSTSADGASKPAASPLSSSSSSAANSSNSGSSSGSLTSSSSPTSSATSSPATAQPSSAVTITSTNTAARANPADVRLLEKKIATSVEALGKSSVTEVQQLERLAQELGPQARALVDKITASASQNEAQKLGRDYAVSNKARLQRVLDNSLSNGSAAAAAAKEEEAAAAAAAAAPPPTPQLHHHQITPMIESNIYAQCLQVFPAKIAKAVADVVAANPPELPVIKATALPSTQRFLRAVDNHNKKMREGIALRRASLVEQLMAPSKEERDANKALQASRKYREDLLKELAGLKRDVSETKTAVEKRSAESATAILSVPEALKLVEQKQYADALTAALSFRSMDELLNFLQEPSVAGGEGAFRNQVITSVPLTIIASICERLAYRLQDRPERVPTRLQLLEHIILVRLKDIEALSPNEYNEMGALENVRESVSSFAGGQLDRVVRRSLNIVKDMFKKFGKPAL